jgi:hypothetical protein
MVTGDHLLHAGTHLFHNPGTFVAQYGRQGGGQVLVSHHKVGVTYPGSNYPNEDLVVPRIVQFDLL